MGFNSGAGYAGSDPEPGPLSTNTAFPGAGRRVSVELNSPVADVCDRSQLRDSRCLPSNMTCQGVSHGDASKLNVLGYSIDDDETFRTSDERSRTGNVVRFILVCPCSSRTVRGDAHRRRMAQTVEAGSICGIAAKRD